MSFQVTIKEITTEKVVKGKARWEVANVVYDYKGENRTQKVVSFANPAVFEILKTLKEGDFVTVEATKNDAGYSQWAKVELASAEDAASPAAPRAPGKVVGSNYETPQERADNRVRIVRQSALNYAIATLSSGGQVVSEDAVYSVAQRYFDWVYATVEDESPE